MVHAQTRGIEGAQVGLAIFLYLLYPLRVLQQRPADSHQVKIAAVEAAEQFREVGRG